ncbi:MAG: HPr family phosphocarrier protein [Clostridia bacterium]|nr:HPr family phosphocarrier protein [Clostridia bacterium]
MNRIVYTVSDPGGIHARPAGRIVSTARQFSADIRLILPVKDASADAKKLFAVMGLGVKKGDTIHMEAEGEDAAEAMETLRNTLMEAGV